MNGPQVSEKCIRILTLLGDGKTIHQITESNPDISRIDVALAARDALAAMKRIVTANQQESAGNGTKADGKYSVEVIRREFANAYAPWSEEDDHELAHQYSQTKDIAELADFFHRKPGAIQARLKKLELI